MDPSTAYLKDAKKGKEDCRQERTHRSEVITSISGDFNTLRGYCPHCNESYQRKATEQEHRIYSKIFASEAGTDLIPFRKRIN